MDIYRNATILLALLFVATAPEASRAINTIETGRSLNRTTVRIDAHEDCNRVTNTGARTYFIPTKTSLERSTFLNHLPPRVTAEPCIDCGYGQGYRFTLPDGTIKIACMFPFTFSRSWTSDAPDYLTLSTTPQYFCSITTSFAQYLYCQQVDTSCTDGWINDPNAWTITRNISCEAPDAPEGWEPLDVRMDCETGQHLLPGNDPRVESCSASKRGHQCWYNDWGNKMCGPYESIVTCQADVAKVACIKQ